MAARQRAAFDHHRFPQLFGDQGDKQRHRRFANQAERGDKHGLRG